MGTRSASQETFSPMERYVPFLSQQIRFDLLRQHPLRILYDPMYGAGQGHLDRLFQEQAGYAIDCLHNTHDPFFGGRIPEPKGEWLPELLQQVPQGGYQLGIANDGDADRFGIVDETGRFLSANEILPLLLRYLVTHRGMKGATVRTVATSSLLDCVADKFGIPVHETPVGFKYVGEWMRKEPIIVGGEESGGLSILGHIPEKDGMLADLLVAEMMAVEGKPLSAIFNDMKREIGIDLHLLSENLHLNDTQKQETMAFLKELTPGKQFGGRTIERIDNRDGVKLVFGAYDWMLVRPSGTEPILRLYGESPDEKNLATIQEAMASLLKEPVKAH
jgi:phosphomannomutase